MSACRKYYEAEHQHNIISTNISIYEEPEASQFISFAFDFIFCFLTTYIYCQVRREPESKKYLQ